MPASESRQPKARFLVRELGRVTWPDLMRIMEKHNGVWGGCWCVAFHVKPAGSDQTAASSRAYNERLVRANQSHAGLVYEGVGYPIATREKPYSNSFLWGGTQSMFAKAGFSPLGALGTSKMVMRRVVRRR